MLYSMIKQYLFIVLFSMIRQYLLMDKVSMLAVLFSMIHQKLPGIMVHRGRPRNFLPVSVGETHVIRSMSWSV